MNNNTTRQTELPLNAAGATGPICPSGSGHRKFGSHRQPTRIERAAWWFGRMRQTVDNATAWNSHPARP